MRQVLFGLVLLGLGAAAAAQAPPADAGVDKATVVANILALEKEPLRANAGEMRNALLRWLVDTQDVTVVVCLDAVGNPENLGKYKRELLLQLTFSQAAFLIRNPAQKTPTVSAQLAGLEGTLRTYHALLTADPDARTPVLDDLQGKLDRGELEAHVAQAWKVCQARAAQKQ